MIRRTPIHVVRSIAPVLTVALLLGMSVVLPNRSEHDPDAASHKARVADAFHHAPFFIGRWVGEDASDMIPREAQKLLHPNAILSRTYRSPAGPPVHVLFVHCSDARDMIGHYPPVCYPSTGWTEVPAQTPLASVPIGDHVLPARHYLFQRHGERGNIERIRILNAFILPDGKIATDIDGIHEQSERLAVTVQGVAQLQVITAASSPLNETIESASEILGGLSEIFEALQIGRGEHDET